MVPPSPVQLFARIGIIVFIVGGALALSRRSVTRYQIPVLVLILLTVTVAMTGGIGAFLTSWDAEKIDYRTELVPQGCENESDRVSESIEYSELSSEAQEVFRSALQADQTYTTTTHPDVFQLRLDANPPTYITYNSECYALSAEQRGNFATGFAVIFYLSSSILATFLLVIAIVTSLALGSFKIPMAILVGLASAGGLIVRGVTGVEEVAGATALAGILTWIGLRLFERYSHESFQERMES